VLYTQNKLKKCKSSIVFKFIADVYCFHFEYASTYHPKICFYIVNKIHEHIFTIYTVDYNVFADFYCLYKKNKLCILCANSTTIANSKTFINSIIFLLFWKCSADVSMFVILKDNVTNHSPCVFRILFFPPTPGYKIFLSPLK